MDPANESHASGRWDVAWEHWKHFSFWGLYCALRAVWGGSPTSPLVCLFLLCEISLADSSLALKIGLSWRRQCPSFLAGLWEYSGPQLCVGHARSGTHRNGSSLSLLCASGGSPLPPTVTQHCRRNHHHRKVWRQVCISPCRSLLGIPATHHPWVCSAACIEPSELSILGRMASKMHCLSQALLPADQTPVSGLSGHIQLSVNSANYLCPTHPYTSSIKYVHKEFLFPAAVEVWCPSWHLDSYLSFGSTTPA